MAVLTVSVFVPVVATGGPLLFWRAARALCCSGPEGGDCGPSVDAATECPCCLMPCVSAVVVAACALTLCACAGIVAGEGAVWDAA